MPPKLSKNFRCLDMPGDNEILKNAPTLLLTCGSGLFVFGVLTTLILYSYWQKVRVGGLIY